MRSRIRPAFGEKGMATGQAIRERTAFTLVELLVVISIIAILAGLLMSALAQAMSSGRSVSCISNLKQLGTALQGYASEHDGAYVLASPDMGAGNLHRWCGTRTDTSEPFDATKGPLFTYLGGTDGVLRCSEMASQSCRDSAIAFEQASGGYGMNDSFVGSRCWDMGYPDGCPQPSRQSDFKNHSRTIAFCDTGMPREHDGAQVIIEYAFAQAPWYIGAGSTPMTGWGDPAPSIHFRHNGKANVLWLDGHVASKAMTSTVDSNWYGGNNLYWNVGWFGERDFELWDTE